MQEQTRLGQSFPNLGARVIYAFLAAYPEYIPDPSWTDEESRHQLHEFFYEMLKTCYDHPEHIGIEPEEDKCFQERWHLNNSNPALMDAMLKVEKKFFDFFGVLYKVSQTGQAAADHLYIAKTSWKLTPKTLDKWAALGLSYEITQDGVILRCAKYPKLFPAFKKRGENASLAGGMVQEILTRFLFGSIPGQPYRAAEMFGGELCYTRTKVCDNCGYCTQTDKSGKRLKLALPLKYPGGVTSKCPLWPWFTWNELDKGSIEKIKKLFLFAEEKLYGHL